MHFYAKKSSGLTFCTRLRLSQNERGCKKKIVKSHKKVFKCYALKMSGKSKDIQELTFEQAYKRLQTILSELNSPNVALDTLVEKYSAARECLEICRKRLAEAQLQINKLGADGIEKFEQ